MQKMLCSLVLLSLACTTQAQDVKANYQKAFDELHAMLKGEIKPSFKRAVFVTENAYRDQQLDEQAFETRIGELVTLVREVAANDNLVYDRKDRQQVLLSSSIFKAMKQTTRVEMQDSAIAVSDASYRYDLDDFWGQKDWTKMFVVKLLDTHTGNCHSLPALYKILADELNVKAWLAITPNHTYIKQWCDQEGWYNTELTNGTFPYDAQIKINNYIKSEAIASGVYMDTLSAKETISYVITDLAQGYVKKTGYDDIGTPLRWLEVALTYYPDYPNAMILQAELQKKQYEQVMKRKGAAHFSQLWSDPVMKSKFTALEKSYLSIHQLGYRRMPKEMYLNWLHRVNKDSTRQPYHFKAPQPFQQYHYQVYTMTAGNGENSEFFDQEEVVRIGSAELNVITGHIVNFAEPAKDELPDEAMSRMYDPALGRFWQIDPHADNYLNFSPYTYVLDNPVNYTDPDGRDVIFDIARNRKGEITGVTLRSTIYITGDGASEERAKELNETANRILRPGSSKNGVGISFKVTYKYAAKISEANLKSGENILAFSKEKSKTSRDDVHGKTSHVKSVYTRTFDPKTRTASYEYFTGRTGIMYGDERESDINVLHETLHFLGLSDRYDNEEVGKTDEGFENDIMGVRGATNINDEHYNNYGIYFNSINPSTSSYLNKKFIDRDSRGHVVSSKKDARKNR